MSTLVEGQVYIASKDFETNKFTVSKGTRLVYDREDHQPVYDIWFHQFHFEDDPSRVLAFSGNEIPEKLEGMEGFQPTDHLQGM